MFIRQIYTAFKLYMFSRKRLGLITRLTWRVAQTSRKARRVTVKKERRVNTMITQLLTKRMMMKH